MGVGGPGALGLHITIFGDPLYDPALGRLTRVSEVTVAGAAAGAVGNAIRANGLKIGWRFPIGGPRVVSVEFGLESSGTLPGQFTLLPEDAAITVELEDILGGQGRWYGVSVAPPVMELFPNEAVFVRLKLRRVHFGNPQHFIVIPVAVVLGTMAFDAHALGINILTGGAAFGSRNYETTVQSL